MFVHCATYIHDIVFFYVASRSHLVAWARLLQPYTDGSRVARPSIPTAPPALPPRTSVTSSAPILVLQKSRSPRQPTKRMSTQSGALGGGGISILLTQPSSVNLKTKG